MARELKHIVVTGSQGQLGREFQKISMDSPCRFTFLSKRELDITSGQSQVTLGTLQPDIVVNCAAYTAVDQAEDEKELAMTVNAGGAEKLATICADLNVPIIHFSSDYVYHNRLRRPLKETDPTRPKSVYGKSKLKGEKLIQKVHPFPIIIRVSWLYSTFGKNFPKTMLHLAQERTSLRIVADQIGAPTNARDLAHSVIEIIENNQSDNWADISGVYNFSNEGSTSWYKIACFIIEYAELDCLIHPIKSIEYPTKAKRPRYSILNLSKFNRTFGGGISKWEESMKICLSELLNER